MIKFSLSLFILSLIPYFVSSQNWQTVGGGTNGSIRGFYTDTVENKLYAVGNFTYAGDSLVYQVVSWDGSVWNKIGNGTGDSACWYGCNPIINVVKHGSDIYVSGMHVIMGGVYGNKLLSKWDGNTWQTCGNPNNLVGLGHANDSLFAIGGFDTISGQHIEGIAKWNGMSWEMFGTPLSFFANSGVVSSAAYYKNQYYFAGNFELGGGLNEIILWDTAQWKPLLSGILGNSYVTDMIEYNGLLYIGGVFYESDGNVADFIMAWDGQQWINPFPSIQYFYGINDLTVIDNKLYISGNFVLPNDTAMFSLAYYDGVDFCAFGGRAIFPDIPVPPLVIGGLNNEVYVSCELTFWGDTLNYIAKWIGGSSVEGCETISTGISETQVDNSSLSIYPNPASSQITIEFELSETKNVSFEIRNVLGQTFKTISNNVFVKGNNKIEIDVREFSTGIYFIQLQSGNKISNQKFIKQ